MDDLSLRALYGELDEFCDEVSLGRSIFKSGGFFESPPVEKK